MTEGVRRINEGVIDVPHLQCASLCVVWMTVHDLCLLPVYRMRLFHGMLCYI